MSKTMLNYEIIPVGKHGASLYFRISRSARKILALKKGDIMAVSVVGDELRARKLDIPSILPRMPANGEPEE